MKRRPTGHILAFSTSLIWSTTFVSTKYLLQVFTPIDILFIRFIMGFITLCIIYPRDLLKFNKKGELYFAAAGLTGVTMYYLLENIALTYTLASNVGIIVSTAPIFTAIAAHLFLSGERLHKAFFIGFILAISGIILITFNNSFNLHINPLGDLLAVLAAIVWAIYSILTKQIAVMNYNMITATRKMFFYGLLFMLPIFYCQGIVINLNEFTNISYLLNILFLGIGASAICFVTWNLAIDYLGATDCTAYIYLGPVITITTAAVFLDEKISVTTIIGCLLTFSGLLISENRFTRKHT
ncbi:DMT family transporter [Pectinatus frisingensis]|uniref:DMT family transporter n=1 Tax=Pectinatus frisingensis TaxID=865 RepID=UPI0018C5AB78|nr:DMT family transporter [Pectinatus frisingensis]